MIYPCENGSKSIIILFFILLFLLVPLEFVGGTGRLQANESMKNDESSNKIDLDAKDLYKKDNFL